MGKHAVMARVFVTGSADGLGLMAARHLVETGHEVVLHARSDARAAEAFAAVPGAAGALSGDLASLPQTRELAERANADGAFDAVIHNAGIGYREAERDLTAERLPRVLAVNTLAPYVLTALMRRPKRLIYLSSGLHRDGDASLDDLTWESRPWDGYQAYADSKLHDALLAFAIARKWPDTLANAVEPGWVATKMGGPSATDDLEQGYRTQTWLAVSDAPQATRSGEYWYHRKLRATHPAVRDTQVQDALLAACERLTGIALAA